MNKLLKSIVVTVGVVDVIFSIFIPIAVSLLLINLGTLSNLNAGLVMTLGIISSFYRAINFWIFE